MLRRDPVVHLAEGGYSRSTARVCGVPSKGRASGRTPLARGSFLPPGGALLLVCCVAAVIFVVAVDR